MDTNQKILIKKALERHSGKILKYCGSETNWKDCFTIIELNNKKELLFWYNLENGATYNEIMEIN